MGQRATNGDRELQEREKFRREFIGNLAHELKTPIFNIQGYILTLLEGGLEDGKVNRDFLERASNGVERLMKIVEDLDLIAQARERRDGAARGAHRLARCGEGSDGGT